MRRALLLTACYLLSACGPNDKINTLFGQQLPGLGDLDTISKEDHEEDAWWGKYYGH